MRQERSVWTKMFIPLVVAMLIQVVFIIGVIYAVGTVQKLDQNEYGILRQKIINRGDYLQETMKKWAQLDSTVSAVNQIVSKYEMENPNGLSELETDDVLYTAILDEAAPVLVDLMRQNMVNGVFLVLSTSSLEEIGNKPGIYLRDLNALSNSPEDNSDLLAKRMPAEISRSLNIGYDFDWKPIFQFGEYEECYDFFRKPYEEALIRTEWNSKDLGYWSHSFTLTQDTQKVIAYSVPLKLSDGTVYGVLGIDVTEEHVRNLMDYHELNNSDMAAYLLGILDEENTVKPQVFNGVEDCRLTQEAGKVFLTQGALTKSLAEAWSVSTENKSNYLMGIHSLNIYDRNSPFEEDWVLCGMVDAEELFSYSNQMQKLLRGTTLVCLLGGVLIVVFVTQILSRPLLGMVQAVRESNPRSPVKIPVTSVKELNELGRAIEQFSEDAFDISTKFDQIIKMASVELAGFEIDEESGMLYVSEGFFGMFGRVDVKEDRLDAERFNFYIKELDEFVIKREEKETLYELNREDGKAWIRLRIGRNNKKCYGLAENVTKEILEIRKVEYERDYDMLTNLLNRRAFRVRCEEALKQEPQTLRHGAMMMIDLDNLKLLNDNYGHEWGDRYIQLAALSIRKFLPESSLVARMSGDEFQVFLYGYDKKSDIREILHFMERCLGEEYMVLPDNKTYKLRMSGGLAWYPEDAQDFSTLVKYADFAMYKVKNSVKGKFWYFDKNSYLKEYYLLQNKEELNRLIEQQLVEYHFQPIIEARTGKIFAYEALMRSLLKAIPSVQEILTLARQEYKLGQIEKLTWFKAMDAFIKLRHDHVIGEECKVFINSIPNQILSQEDCASFVSLYAEALPLIVAEVTEEEKMNLDVQECKNNLIRQWGAQIAIDDYGTGYNSQSVLIRISPEFIKIDMGFVRNVQLDEKKQMMIRNTVAYAHEHAIGVIAEGVENLEEVETLLHLNVDYFQGYYYASPSSCPQPPKESRIRELVALAALKGN